MRRLSLMLCLPALLFAAQPATRDMSLTTPDGFVLKGSLTIPPQPGLRPVVLLAHQFQADRSDWKDLAAQLNARGIATLAIDLRGHGESTRKAGEAVAVTPDFMESAKAVGFDKIPADLAQAAAWVRKQPRINPRRLGLAGSSVGGFASLLAASSIRPVALLTLSPAGNGAFGEDPDGQLLRAVGKARSAVMVMAAEDDQQAAANAAAIKSLPGVYARIVPGADHGSALIPGEADFMAGWLAEYLTYPVAGRARTATRAAEDMPAEENKAQVP